ncbi:BTB domain containing protein [Pyrenophora tritici-repentis]|uniref:BTB/POZ domain containing protein n=2 Tax=Pyrenophora tritici-repentis TaxID=45151 RepID=A0A2W1EK75_9PLEO|nr:uncharacterized protein PTRG_02329 [Pyrenophora tritici-repentis Pt-1C-BFP]KAG9386975.1 BTB domain containing protein [Pyrenophora tritici-repentis]EDU44852.1 predicted protein [Pyrenophora tritici-repentis Pt-1C-BFP]KAI1518309.1 BTB/POZ domain containing protein [Pyrenophora tritici-repentis]KAI1528316.1 BTB domain containing protein [Pyrenophora tritici-repentis]KAI1538605.1 BTB domain containing protein [Pyrenophora tritici-repentis]
MGLDKANTPPMTPSRPSDTPTPSIETSEAPVEAHNSQASVAFKPLQMLVKTPLTVECGEDLTVKFTMHVELLCCHSKLLADRFAAAKPLREQYELIKKLCDKLVEYFFPEVTPKQFESGHLEVEVIPLIVRAYEQWPLPVYANSVKIAIDNAVQEQITAKNIQNITVKDLGRITDLSIRLSHIKSRGVQTIVEKLYVLIHQITKKEEKRALKEKLRAAAQHRLLLPDVDSEIVAILMQWIYHGALHYQDAEQLYAVLRLAIMLGVDALAEICLTKLYDAASESIEDASNSGVKLQTLLGFGPDSVDHALGVVFKNVINDRRTPKRLRDLVIDALAASLDKELFTKIKDLISKEMALEIIEAMIDNSE